MIRHGGDVGLNQQINFTQIKNLLKELFNKTKLRPSFFLNFAVFQHLLDEVFVINGFS